MFDFIESLRQKIKQPLPGIDVQYEMAPTRRQKFHIENLAPNTFKKSAVMVMIYQAEGEFYIPLTKRHDYDGTHSNQISLPGGKFEETDKTLINTALRELNEEIGIAGNLNIIGPLTPLYIPVSNFYVEPYVSVYTNHSIEFKPNEREVKQLIPLSIETLKNDAIIEKDGIVKGDGYQLKTPYFNVEGEIIWGATAMILNEFKKLII